MADPEKIAELITKRAAEVLAPMELEMNRKGWPEEFRAIMWDAVATMAAGMASASRKAAKP